MDDVGTEITVPQKPSRIISLTYGTDEILMALVSPDRIAALSKYAGDPAISFLTKEEVDKVGKKVDLNMEAIMKEKPDLVIVSTATPKNVTDTLRASGISVYQSKIPYTYGAMEEKIMGIAKAVNEEEKGKEVLLEMKKKTDALEEKLSVIPEDKKKKALGLSFRGIQGKKGTLFAEILKMAKVDDVAERYEAPRRANVYLSVELIPEMNPDVILMPVWQRGEGISEEAFAEELLANPALQGVTAIKEKNLIRFPEKYKYVMSQHLPDAVEAAAKAIYPKLFDDPTF